ncbi:glycosyltransferase family 4 protein [Geobacter sp. FeAm09]|uniref:glycosyltransferase family 4 protein n=1 Tax=Geobacter sp. FeAm09 TaxID=2597769 RepID=UPI0011EF8F48|nr:glycosyltransferase family 1 protein [Geobacter sp. FeAm09]QEM66877.1 glycosyltransferase family 4 protein [Geobacter sp. FeAm09]
MRIIANAYLGKKMTGIGRYFLEIVDAISKIDPSIEFVIYTNVDNFELLEYNFNNPNISIRPYGISKMRPVANLLFNGFMFPLIILRERADIVYIPNFSPLLFKVRPTVSVIYDTIEFKLHNKFSKLRTLYRQFIVPRMAKLSDHIITISESSKRDIIELFRVDEKKITVAYCAVSGKFSHEKEVVSPVDSKYILYVGTVDHPGKNVFNTIKAFERYKNKYDDSLKLVICGMPGKGFETVAGATKSSPFASDIIYKGYVTDAELFRLYACAQLFIFTSRYEGFGLPVLEAMRYGLPVITSDKSSLPEVAGDAAIICDPDDIEAMAEGIAHIVHEPLLRTKLIQSGYRNLSRFSWEDSARKSVEVFKNVYNRYYSTK